jgi:hypothetical protein
MSVPIHNLYDYIYQVLERRFILYYFYPFGHKEFDNLISYHEVLKNKFGYPLPDAININPDANTFKILPPRFANDPSRQAEFEPTIICHDQEPLDFDYYEPNNYPEHLKSQLLNRRTSDKRWNKNLRIRCRVSNNTSFILLHSELNSDQVARYESTGDYKCAYWWSHAMLGKDWYRFAEVDSFLKPASSLKKLFLVYCRETSGKRTYRSDFLKLLNHSRLQDNVQIGSFHKYDVTSHTSAEYDINDLNQTLISVILETCFDRRIHLTEKTVRALATGHPFILVAGPHSLEYLRSYGFKTFAPYINESYDSEADPYKRMNMVVDEMVRLSNLSKPEMDHITKAILEIAEYNKKLFFNENFTKTIVSELKDNVFAALEKTENNVNWQKLWEQRKEHKKLNPEHYKKPEKLPDDFDTLSSDEQTYWKISLHSEFRERNFYYTKIARHVKQGGTVDNYDPPWEK